MNDDSNSGNGAGRKPRKPNARLLWHKANHREAWAGLVKMPPEEVGVYWRIILLQYINRAAHAFAEDAEMAQACHCTLKEFRRIRKKLFERGRLEIDEENGIYWDKRAMTEMVEAGFLSEEQIQRANQRWAKPPPAEPAAKPRVVVDNVRALTDEAAGKLAEVGLKYPSISAPTTPGSQTQTEPDQTLSSLSGHASRVQSPDINPNTAQSPAPAATLPLRGSGGGDLKKQRQKAALDALKQHRPAEPPKGFDATESAIGAAPNDQAQAPPGDRRATRTDNSKKRSA